MRPACLFAWLAPCPAFPTCRALTRGWLLPPALCRARAAGGRTPLARRSPDLVPSLMISRPLRYTWLAFYIPFLGWIRTYQWRHWLLVSPVPPSNGGGAPAVLLATHCFAGSPRHARGYRCTCVCWHGSAATHHSIRRSPAAHCPSLPHTCAVGCGGRHVHRCHGHSPGRFENRACCAHGCYTHTAHTCTRALPHVCSLAACMFSPAPSCPTFLQLCRFSPRIPTHPSPPAGHVLRQPGWPPLRLWSVRRLRALHSLRAARLVTTAGERQA